ncbi:MAG: hypothetical protein GF411_03500 [Candidatus Lokiarchaeota archaeon]|nr:hypothetical protein [Candidatus Lokiarchaeota archaeon]
MDQEYHYFTLLVLSILTLSSLYLGFSASTGFGDIEYQTVEIESISGYNLTCKVYSPRIRSYYEKMPVIVTIPDLGQSFESLYAVNIELARRNFTVMSFDLSSEEPVSASGINQTQIDIIAQDIYFVFLNYTNRNARLSNDTYGVIGYSVGFQIALSMNVSSNEPLSYVAIGNSDMISIPDAISLPGNTYFAMGYNSTSLDSITESLMNVTGESEISLGETYGSFENQTAYKFTIFPTQYDMQLNDIDTTVSSVEWSVRSVQGNEQFNKTLPTSAVVFHYGYYTQFLAPLFFFGTLVPLFTIIISIFPRRIQPQQLGKNELAPNMINSFGLSSGLASLTSILLVILLSFSYSIISLIASILISLYFAAFVLSLGNNKDTKKMIFNTTNVFQRNSEKGITDWIVSLIISGLCIFWIIIWMYLAPLITILEFSFVLDFFTVLQSQSTILKGILIIGPIFLYVFVESLIIRGFNIAEREWDNRYPEMSNFIFALAARTFVMLVIVDTVVLLAISNVFLGFQVAVFMIYFAFLMIISTVTITWATIKMKNPLPAIVLSTLIYTIIILSII